jgi:hypothetical protein
VTFTSRGSLNVSSEVGPSAEGVWYVGQKTDAGWRDAAERFGSSVLMKLTGEKVVQRRAVETMIINFEGRTEGIESYVIRGRSAEERGQHSGVGRAEERCGFAALVHCVIVALI